LDRRGQDVAQIAEPELAARFNDVQKEIRALEKKLEEWSKRYRWAGRFHLGGTCRVLGRRVATIRPII